MDQKLTVTRLKLDKNWASRHLARAVKQLLRIQPIPVNQL